MTQQLITALARMQNSPCDKHGDVISCRPLTGYVMRSVYEVVFEDGLRRVYWLRAGRPVAMEAQP